MKRRISRCYATEPVRQKLCMLERAAGIEPASSAWKAEVIAIIRCPLVFQTNNLKPGKLVEGEGFEPSKAEPSDLQSDPFGHSGIPPDCGVSQTTKVQTHARAPAF